MTTHVCTLDYTERALEADRRHARREFQVYCLECRLWRWPEECAHADRLTPQQFAYRFKAPTKEARG